MRSAVIVALITTRVRGLPVEVRLGPGEGMDRECVINLDEIHTVKMSIILEYVTTLSAEKMLAVERALRYALALR